MVTGSKAYKGPETCKLVMQRGIVSISRVKRYPLGDGYSVLDGIKSNTNCSETERISHLFFVAILHNLFLITGLYNRVELA